MVYLLFPRFLHLNKIKQGGYLNTNSDSLALLYYFIMEFYPSWGDKSHKSFQHLLVDSLELTALNINLLFKSVKKEGYQIYK